METEPTMKEFQVGDKVKVTTPVVVDEEFKDEVGVVSHIEFLSPCAVGALEQVVRITYSGGTSQVAYVETDGVVLVERAKEEAPTELTEGASKGKVASDGGPSEYYDFPEGCSTLNDLIEYKEMSFAQGNIFKAAYRLGNKEGIGLEYDLKKIKYYADRMLAHLGEK